MINKVNIFTPEYVQVPFTTAGIGTRSIAKLIDFLCIFTILVPISSMMTSVSSLIPFVMDDTIPSILIALIFIILFFIPITYFTVMEYWMKGQTLGKKVMKLRVIADNGRSPTFSSIFLRNLFQWIDMLPGFFLLGMLFIFINRKEKRLGDLVAGTLVIFEKKEKETEIYFQHTYITLSEEDQEKFAVVPTLSAEQFLYLESYLARRRKMSTDIRHQMATTFIAKCCPHIHVHEGKEELFLEKLYLYMRKNEYKQDLPQLIQAYFPKV